MSQQDDVCDPDSLEEPCECMEEWDEAQEPQFNQCIATVLDCKRPSRSMNNRCRRKSMSGYIYCKYHEEKSQENPPELAGRGTLKLDPWQKDALQLMIQRCRNQWGLNLIHSVGSGKTLSSWSLLRHFPRNWPWTIIAPVGLLPSWFWTTEDALSVFGQTVDWRLHGKDDNGNATIYYVSYDDLSTATELQMSNWFRNRVVLFEEFHTILPFMKAAGDPQGSRWLRNFEKTIVRARRCVGLTGTPLLQSYTDIMELTNIASRFTAKLPTNEEALFIQYERLGSGNVVNGYALPLLTNALSWLAPKIAGAASALIGGGVLTGAAVGIAISQANRNAVQNAVERQKDLDLERMSNDIKPYISFFDSRLLPDTVEMTADDVPNYPNNETIMLFPHADVIEDFVPYNGKAQEELAFRANLYRLRMNDLDTIGVKNLSKSQFDINSGEATSIGNLLLDGHHELPIIEFLDYNKPYLGYIMSDVDVKWQSNIFDRAIEILESYWKFAQVSGLKQQVPVVYSNFFERGVCLFSSYLNQRGKQHLVYDKNDPSEVRKNILDYKTKKIDYDGTEGNEFYFAAVLHPDLREGLNFPYARLEVVMETVKGPGFEIQVYGRILRKYPSNNPKQRLQYLTPIERHTLKTEMALMDKPIKERFTEKVIVQLCSVFDKADCRPKWRATMDYKVSNGKASEFVSYMSNKLRWPSVNSKSQTWNEYFKLIGDRALSVLSKQPGLIHRKGKEVVEKSNITDPLTAIQNFPDKGLSSSSCQFTLMENETMRQTVDGLFKIIAKQTHAFGLCGKHRNECNLTIQECKDNDDDDQTCILCDARPLPNLKEKKDASGLSPSLAWDIHFQRMLGREDLPKEYEKVGRGL